MTSSDREDRVRAVLDTDRGRLAREAALWLVRLAERPHDESLKARIESWCAESDLNREAWDRTRQTYGRLGQAPVAHPSYWQDLSSSRPAAVQPPAAAESERRAHALPRRRLASATALALAACLAFVAGPSVVLSLRSDHMTSTAESRTVTLEDGSQVRLAPRSALQVAYSPGERRTRLLQGEAFFEVSRSEERPFTVVAGDVVTTVLGTAFDVRLDEDGAAVAVQRGRVRVSASGLSPPLSEQLEAGEALRVEAGGRPTRETVEPQDIGAWRAGMFVARARPIGEIVGALRRHYDGVILVRHDAFLARRISGAYDLRTPALTLRGLASAHDADVRQITPWLLVVTPR